MEEMTSQDNSQKPILVTGSHRSGTTWVGRMLASSPKVVYIHEPFNLSHDIGICGAQFEHWFTYICKQNEHKYFKQIKDTIEFRYNIFGKLKISKKSEPVSREVRNYLQFVRYRRNNMRPLLKDPIAVFSAEWLSLKFDMETIVMIRHPAAFAGSLKMKNWTHPFSHFLAQPLLMNEYLYPFENEIRYFVDDERDIIDQAALLWKLIHYMILKFKENQPNWLFVRHEDLSRNPIFGFETMFNKVGLEFSERVAETVKNHSSLNSLPNSESRYFKDVQRNSVSNIWTWRDRLTSSEIERIKSRVHEISEQYYSDDEW